MLKNRSEIVALVEQYVEALSSQGIEVDQAYLFGSYLYGTAGEYSDVDLVVVSPDFEGMQLWERPVVMGRASHAVFQSTGESVEALAKTPVEVANRHPASFLGAVLKDAEVVYDGRRAQRRREAV